MESAMQCRVFSGCREAVVGLPSPPGRRWSRSDRMRVTMLSVRERYRGSTVGVVPLVRLLRSHLLPGGEGKSLTPHHFPIRFAFSSSYHHVAGTPRSYLGFVAGRPYMSQ